METSKSREQLEEEEALRVTKALLNLVILTEGGNKSKNVEGAPVVKKVKVDKFLRKISLVLEGDEKEDEEDWLLCEQISVFRYLVTVTINWHKSIVSEPQLSFCTLLQSIYLIICMFQLNTQSFS